MYDYFKIGNKVVMEGAADCEACPLCMIEDELLLTPVCHKLDMGHQMWLTGHITMYSNDTFG